MLLPLPPLPKLSLVAALLLLLLLLPPTLLLLSLTVAELLLPPLVAVEMKGAGADEAEGAEAEAEADDSGSGGGTEFSEVASLGPRERADGPSVSAALPPSACLSGSSPMSSLLIRRPTAPWPLLLGPSAGGPSGGDFGVGGMAALPSQRSCGSGSASPPLRSSAGPPASSGSARRRIDTAAAACLRNAMRCRVAARERRLHP